MIRYKNYNKPTDIYQRASLCVKKGDFQNASDLLVLGGVYTSFDSERVNSPSAKTVLSIFLKRFFDSLSPTEEKAYKASTSFSQIDSPAYLRSVCRKIHGMGYPTYYPDYLIGGTVYGLVTDFDPLAAWTNLFERDSTCPM